VATRLSVGWTAIAADTSRPLQERLAAFIAGSPQRQREDAAMWAELNAIESSIRERETRDKIRWRSDELELDGDKIIIRRRGLANALAVGLSGERTILISTLTAVQVKPAGLLSPGYILFSYAGNKPFMGGVIEATQDPDAFIFDRPLNARVAAFKAKVEKVMRDSRQAAPASNAPSTLADELRKLADLKQQGVLTQEEFDMAKKKLLSR
jgi:hypothetical protein